MRLDVTVGADRSVTVTGDDNLVPLVVTRVDGDELVVETSESYTTEIGLTAVVTVPKLTGVSISGAGKGHVKGLSNEGFEVDISGAAKLTLEGTTKTFSLDVSGASNVDATKLAAQDVKVSSSGASKLKVDAQKTLDVEVSGAGKVRYKGSPTVTKDISGAASVKAL